MQFRLAMLSIGRLGSVCTAIGLLLLAPQVSAASCRARVPPELLSSVERDGGSWRLAELRDLRADDQRLWHKLKHGNCPGVASANFDGSGRKQFALLLLSPTTSKVRLIHALKEPAGRFVTKTLYDGESAATPVVFAGKPGTYSAAEGGEQHKLRLPPIMFSVLEAGATAYYFADHSVHELQLSE